MNTTLGLSAQSLGAFADIFLSAGFGFYCCLIGWNKIKVMKNIDSDVEWKSKYGKLFRIIGPILITVSLAQFAFRSFK